MSTSTERQSFRALVADVAQRAKEKLPECNGRVESAVTLVLAGDVFVSDDGTVEVGSCTDPLTMHRLSGSACTCEDFQHGRAPHQFCKHRLAHAIYTRVHQEMAARSTPVEREPEIELPTNLEPWADNDIEAYGNPHTPALALPLPEAPASVNVRVTVQGREVQWTLRDTDEGRLAARLDALLARYPVPQVPPPPAVPQGQDVHWCRAHQVAMQENHKNGQRWYSHRLPEGGFCKGR